MTKRRKRSVLKAVEELSRGEEDLRKGRTRDWKEIKVRLKDIKKGKKESYLKASQIDKLFL